MRLEIRYLNEFTYGEPAWESHNLLRACPSDGDHQSVVSYRLELWPEARVSSFRDYWGTRVDEFGIREPHMSLRICAESVVDSEAPPRPADDPPLDEYLGVADGLSEYLRSSPHANWDEDVARASRAAVAGAGSSIAAIESVIDLVRSRMEYAPGATFVGMPVGDVMAQGKGVCQDFAHLGIAMLRSVGIPARYVSGYLYAADQTDAVAPEEAELEIQTHAWLEVAVPGHGWWAIDPTNPQPVGELHVKIGHGRDYEDVMPLRGVYHGGADHDLGVKVQITRDRLGQMQQ
jgi:transglutaminase-like putative cysteine protease